MLLDVVGEPRDLFMPILRRNGDEDGLIESATDHLDLAASHESAQKLKVFRMRCFDPFKQRTGIVQPHANRRMAAQKLDERQIRLRIRALEYVVEISDRLVRMDQEDELEFRHREPRKAFPA